MFELIDINGHYDEKKKRCFAKAQLTTTLPNGKAKTFVGKGDTIKHSDDVEDSEFAKGLASVRAVKDVVRQYEDYLLRYSHRFAKNVKPKLAKKVVLNEEEFKNKIKEIHISRKGVDTLLGLIGGMANPIFTKGMNNGR